MPQLLLGRPLICAALAVLTAGCAELLDFGAFVGAGAPATGGGGGGGEGGAGGVGGTPSVAPETRLALSFEGGVTEVNVAARDAVISLAGSYDGSLTIVDRTIGPSDGIDAFASELSPEGDVAWVESEKVAGTQRGLAPFVSADGASYVAGIYTDGVAMFDELATTQSAAAPNFQGYACNLGDDGATIALVGTASTMTARVLAAADVQNSGGVVAGDFMGTLNFERTAARPVTAGGDHNAFVARVFESETAPIGWVKDIGGTFDQRVSGVVFGGGYIYAVGGNSGQSYLSGSLMSLTNGAEDMLVVSLASNGVGQWIRSIGSETNDSAADVAVETGGKIWVIGSFTSSFTVDQNEVPAKGTDGLEDVVLLRLEHVVERGERDTGVVLRAYSFGGEFSQRGLHVEIDGGGYVWIGGVFKGTIDFGDGPHTTDGADEDCFIARFHPEETAARWSTTFGGDGPCVLGGMATFRNASTNEMVIAGTYRGDLEIDGMGLRDSPDQDSIFLAIFTLPP